MEEFSIIICNKEKDECCIVCLKHCKLTEMTHIFEKSEKLQIKISDLLELCGGFKINKSYGFPKGICSKCLRELHNAAAFRDKCQASIEFLMTQVIEIKEDNINNFNINHNEKVPENLNQIENNENLFEVEHTTMENYNNNVQSIKNPNNETICGETVQSISINNDITKLSYNNNNNNNNISDLEEFYDNIDQSLYNTQKELIYQYSCDMCGSAFKTVLNLRKHFRKHTSTWFTCIACWHPFTKKVNLEKHFINSHKKENISAHIEFSDVENENAEVYINDKKNDQYICNHNECNKVFQSIEFLKKHLVSHRKIKKSNNFNCNQCGKLFSSSTKLLHHLRVHDNLRPFGCKYCDMTFKDKSNLSVHIRKHAAIKPHKCTICEKSFSRTNLLEEHLRSHTGERPFSCEICYKSFSKKRVYVNHKMTHSDNKFCCSFCSQKFVRESQLNFHVKNYHKELILNTITF